MRPPLAIGRDALSAWLGFWFGGVPPYGLLALMRIGTALILLYVLFVRAFDLEAQFSDVLWSDPAKLRAIDPVAWPFSIFNWVDGTWWLWSIHALAMVVATAFLLGVLAQFAAALSLAFQLSYVHHNPIMLLGVDALLMLALAYLTVAPSGKALGVLGRLAPDKPVYPPYLAYLEERQSRGVWGLTWVGLPVRVMQIHVCLLYFQSALGKLSTDWLAGTALWHPRLVPLGVPYSLETLQAQPHITSLITYGLLLFELLYGVLIWIPALRYAVLCVAVLVHLAVGFAWGLLPFNLMMIVLNIAFVPARHLEELVRLARPLLTLPWVTTEGRQ